MIKNRVHSLWPLVLLSCTFSARQDSSFSYASETIEIWYDRLPNCPCLNPDSNKTRIGDGWAKDQGSISVYHRGASECFRSYPAVRTNEGYSGQQCCFDETGKLITGGAGAGTPDKISTCDGEDENGVMTLKVLQIVGHYYKDVRPWKNMNAKNEAWKTYNTLWAPNNANDCLKNIR